MYSKQIEFPKFRTLITFRFGSIEYVESCTGGEERTSGAFLFEFQFAKKLSGTWLKGPMVDDGSGMMEMENNGPYIRSNAQNQVWIVGRSVVTVECGSL